MNSTAYQRVRCKLCRGEFLEADRDDLNRVAMRDPHRWNCPLCGFLTAQKLLEVGVFDR